MAPRRLSIQRLLMALVLLHATVVTVSASSKKDSSRHHPPASRGGGRGGARGNNKAADTVSDARLELAADQHGASDKLVFRHAAGLSEGVLQELDVEEQKLFGDEGDDGAGVLGTSQLLPPIRLQLLSESGGTQGGYQLRVMELNLELEQEIEMNNLVVSRITWTMVALMSCVVMRTGLVLLGLETPPADAWWDKPVAAASGALFTLGDLAGRHTGNLFTNVGSLRGEVTKAVGDLTRGR